MKNGAGSCWGFMCSANNGVTNPDFLTETACQQIVTGSTGKTKYQAVKAFLGTKTS